MFIKPGQSSRSRYLVLTKRSATSGDENGFKFETNGGISVDHVNKKALINFVSFLNIPAKQQHILTLLMKRVVYCFYGESMFSGKINLKTVSQPFMFPRFTRNFGAKKDFIH